jgi:hypothetical protein
LPTIAKMSQLLAASQSVSDWLAEGSDKVGQRVRRAILAEDGETVIGYGDGTVVGWLPSNLSDFFSEFTQEPAPLWHIKYDSAELGEEDLEEVEVEDAAEAFEKDAWCNSDKVLEVSELLRKKTLAGAAAGSSRQLLGTTTNGGQDQGESGNHACAKLVFIEGTHRVHETIYFDEVDEPDGYAFASVHSSTNTRAHALRPHAQSDVGDEGTRAPSSAHTRLEGPLDEPDKALLQPPALAEDEPAKVQSKQKPNVQRGACILERMNQLLARNDDTAGPKCAAGQPAHVESARERRFEVEEPVRKRHHQDAASSSAVLSPKGAHRTGAAAKIGCTVLISEAALRAHKQTSNAGSDDGTQGKGWRHALILGAIYGNTDSGIESFILALAPRGISRAQSNTAAALPDSNNDAAEDAEVATVPAALLEDVRSCIASAPMPMPPNYHVSMMVSGQHHAPADTVAAEQMLLVKSAQLERDVPMGLLREPDTRGAPLSTHNATSQRAAQSVVSKPLLTQAQTAASSTSSCAFMSKPLKPKASLPSPSSASVLLRAHTAAAAQLCDATPATAPAAPAHLPAHTLHLHKAPCSSKSVSRHPAQAPGVGTKGTIGRSAFTPVAVRHKASILRGGNGGCTGGVGATGPEGDTRRAGHADESVSGATATETGAMTAGRNAVLHSSKCVRPFSLSCPPLHPSQLMYTSHEKTEFTSASCISACLQGTHVIHDSHAPAHTRVCTHRHLACTSQPGTSNRYQVPAGLDTRAGQEGSAAGRLEDHIAL